MDPASILILLIVFVACFIGGYLVGHSSGQLSGARKAAILFKPEKKEK